VQVNGGLARAGDCQPSEHDTADSPELNTVQQSVSKDERMHSIDLLAPLMRLQLTRIEKSYLHPVHSAVSVGCVQEVAVVGAPASFMFEGSLLLSERKKRARRLIPCWILK
jgi:hypothetical protein